LGKRVIKLEVMLMSLSFIMAMKINKHNAPIIKLCNEGKRNPRR